MELALIMGTPSFFQEGRAENLLANLRLNNL
jgi:hypothetical protein